LLVRRGIGTVPATASVAVDLATELAAQFVFAAIGVAVLLRLPHQGQAAAGWASPRPPSAAPWRSASWRRSAGACSAWWSACCRS
jgi:hypothetical protein